MKKNSPKISVCIPTYKRLELLLEAVDSVRNNGFEDYEIVVSDDDSDPKIEKALLKLKDKKIRYYAHKKQGIQINWTNAVSKATASLVMKLDDDDRIEPRFLQKTVAFLDDNSDVGIVFTGHATHYPDGRSKVMVDSSFFKNRVVVDGFEYGQTFFLNKARPTNHKSAGVFRKKLAENIGYYKKIGADIFFTVAMASQADIGYIPKPLFYYRVHSGVRQGMTYGDLSLSLKSIKAIYELPWVKKSEKWMKIKDNAFRRMRVVVPVMYMANHKYTGGNKELKDFRNRLVGDYPEVLANKIFSLAYWGIYLLPRFLYIPILRTYSKFSLPKKMLNMLIRKKK